VIKKTKGLNPEQINKIMQQLLNGTLYLHNLDIVNRNIALENILVNMTSPSDINIKIFNLDQAIENHTSSNNRVNVYEKVGSVYYMSPEALKKSYSKKSDIWSIGVVMYYLFYGYFPFDGKSVDEIYTKIREGKLTLDESNKNGEIPPKVITLISKMLMFSPDERLNALECLHNSWFDNPIIVQEQNGLGFIVKCAIFVLIKNIYHKHEFISLKSLFNELHQRKSSVNISDIYFYLCEPIGKNFKNKELTYSEFCGYLLTDELLFSNANLSYLFDFIDKNTDNILTLEDFKVLLEYVYKNSGEKFDMDYLLMSLEHKTLVFPEFKQLLCNYHNYLEYL
jgi:serine/threonine protein kinase